MVLGSLASIILHTSAILSAGLFLPGQLEEEHMVYSF